jgi:hypothetical protein
MPGNPAAGFNGGGRVFTMARGGNLFDTNFQGLGLFDPSAPINSKTNTTWNGYTVPGFNTPAATVSFGTWADIEILLTASTPGQYNGQVRQWVNGTLVESFDQIGFCNAVETVAQCSFNLVQLAPIFNDNGSAPSHFEWMRFGFIYMSGK